MVFPSVDLEYSATVITHRTNVVWLVDVHVGFDVDVLIVNRARHSRPGWIQVLAGTNVGPQRSRVRKNVDCTNDSPPRAMGKRFTWVLAHKPAKFIFGMLVVGGFYIVVASSSTGETVDSRRQSESFCSLEAWHRDLFRRTRLNRSSCRERACFNT
jgi:hypothetical protein